MIKQDNYTIGISATDDSGNAVDVFSGHTFTELYIHEAINQFPYFELFLVDGPFEDLYAFKEFKLTFKSEELKYEVPMGIVNMSIRETKMCVKGWLCHWKDIRVPYTQYLGADAKEALTNLNIRETINYDDNITGNIFQINTTNMQQALSICQMCASTPYWNIGRYSINLNPKIEESSADVLDSAENLVINTITETLPEQTDPSSDEASQYPWYSFSWNKGNIDYHFTEHHDLHQNMLKNMKAVSVGPSLIISKSFEYETPFVVGTEFPNSLTNVFPNITKWILTSVMYHYFKNNINTNLQLYGVSDAIQQQQFIDDNANQ